MCRPFLDIIGIKTVEELNFFTDSSGNAKTGGFGCFFDGCWTCAIWEKGFIDKHNLSIEFLELYVLVVGVYTSINYLKNSRVVLFRETNLCVTC